MPGRRAAILGLALAGAMVPGGPARAQGDWDPFADEAPDEPSIEADVSGLVYSRYNVDLQRELDYEDTQEFRSKAWLELYVSEPGKWRAVASGLARHEFYPETGDAEFEPVLWEAYGAWETPGWELVAGQQIRRWGRGVPSILDVLNPADYSEFLFTEDEFTKLPAPMARWTRFGDDYELELVYLPFYEPARTADNDSDWAPISIRDLEGGEDIPLLRQAVEQDVQPGVVTTPADNFAHPEFGLRFSPDVKGMDLDLHLFWGKEDLPAPVFSEDFRRFLVRQRDAFGVPPLDTLRDLSAVEIATFSPMYIQEPQRQLMLGLGLARPIGGVTGRFELATLSAQSVYNNQLERIRVPSVQAAVGVDALANQRFLYSLTLAANTFITDEDLFLFNRFNLSLSGVARWRPFDIDLWLALRGLWNVNLGDSWIGPAVLYDVVTGLQLQAGVQLLDGPEPSPLQQLDENDFAWVRLRYVF